MAPATQITFRKLDGSRPTPVRYEPDADTRKAVAAMLGLRALRKFALRGALRPEGKGWRLEAMLGATVVQDCVVTLDPVTTRIDVPVVRVWEPAARGETADAPEAEIEIDPDTDREPLPASIRIDEIATESLALEIPAFPRAEGAELAETLAGPPGCEPLTDAAMNPFAVLSKLRDKDG